MQVDHNRVDGRPYLRDARRQQVQVGAFGHRQTRPIGLGAPRRDEGAVHHVGRPKQRHPFATDIELGRCERRRLIHADADDLDARTVRRRQRLGQALSAEVEAVVVRHRHRVHARRGQR